MNYHPLVSVVVVTYNSADTILETLESIERQTYDNIELIISDDNSKDNTIQICKDWIKKEKDKLKSIKLLEVNQNTGVAGNINRGVKSANGDYIKSLAGDDILFDHAIESYVELSLKTNCMHCCSKVQCFGINKKLCEVQEEYLENNIYKYLKTNDRKKQFNQAIREHVILGPSLFYKKRLWEEIGGFDERFPMADEMPYEIMTLKRYACLYIDQPLVKWRIRDDSLCHDNKDLRNLNSEYGIFFKLRLKELLKHGMFFLAYSKFLNLYIERKLRLGKSPLYRLLYFSDPLWCIKFCKNIL